MTRIRRARQVAAVNRRAARGVGYQHPVAEKLREEFDVGRFAAARAGPGELEQRLEQLRALDRIGLDLGAIDVGNGEEEIPVRPFAIEVRSLGLHVDGLVLDLFLVLGRAHVDAQPAAGAIVRGHLHGELPAGIFLALVIGRFESGRGIGQQGRIENLCADRGVRAAQRAQAALGANLRVPDGNVLGDAPLFVLRGGGGEGAVVGQCTDGQVVAPIGDHHAQHVFDELRGIVGHGRHHVQVRRDLVGIFHLVERTQCAVYRRVILLDDLAAALFAVSLFDGVLDLGDGLVGGNHVGQLEKAGLHDGVDAHAHLDVPGHAEGVDHVEFHLLVDDLFLHLGGQMIPHFVRAVWAVQ